jgi:hypothetical protein
MMGFRTIGFAALAFAVLPPSAEVWSEESVHPAAKGCPFEISVQRVNEFMQKSIADMAGIQQPMLEELVAISQKGKAPGVALSKQLSAQDTERFKSVRHSLIESQAEELKYGEFQRDVHVIAETLQVARLADLYEVKSETLGDADPRRFYFTILESLRVAQPKTFRSELVDVGLDCDPEAGLFFEESFNQQELGKGGDDQHLVDLISDIERLRNFYQLVWMSFTNGIADIRATTWVGDTPNTPDTISSAVASSSNSMQQMWRVTIPYIDKQMPSEKQLEMAYRQKFNEAVEQEYPAR